MKSFFKKLDSFVLSPRTVPLFFAVIAILAYGLFIWRHGFYWDDLPMSWIRYQLGVEAMKIYFSTSRPVWAVLYQITTSFIPQVPLSWEVFALVWRWLGVILLWMILRELWPGRKRMILITSLFFLLYPGFNLQFVSFLTSHFYIVICIFLSSYLLMLWALRTPRYFWSLTIAAMVLSLLNLWMMEYFYSLELVRVFIILYAVYRTSAGQRFMQIVRQILLHWFPYLLVFLVNVFYRTFVFTNVAYQNNLITELRTDPTGAILALIKTVASDLWLVSGQAWTLVFNLPRPAADGPRTTLLYLLVLLCVGVLVFIFLYRYVHDEDDGKDRHQAFWAIGLGFAAMVLGGGPYWLASLEISLAFPASRFTMSFMLGVSLMLAGLFELMPSRARVIFSSLLIALAAGRQVMISDAFRSDWDAQRNLFWQMQWRAPGLKPDTLVLMNEALSYYADNSISAPLNWIYAPNQSADHIHYVLFYPTNRLGKTLPDLSAESPVSFSYIAGEFNGNTSDALAFYYDPPACLRLLEPDLDPNNRFIPDASLMREASALSNTDRILTQQTAVMPSIYGPEPEHGWCYYFQKADLARQTGDWEEVVKFGNMAFELNDYPNNPIERFVFIEGYAHTGEWDRAIEYSKVSYKVSKDYMGPLLCQLWERIETETVDSPKRNETLAEVRSMFACSP